MPAPKVERLPDSRVVCTVTFEPDDVKKSQDQALRTLSAQVNLPGFRPGKAPPELVKEQIKEEHVLEETVKGLLPQIFSKLMKENDIKPIIHPKVELQKKDPLTLKITFVEKPIVTIKGLEKIKIEKKAPAFDQKDIENMERYMLEQHRKYTQMDRASKSGDRLTVDFHGTDADEKEIPGTRSVDYQLVLGSKTLIPGFEDALLELKPGEKKSFKLNFPEKYHEKSLSGAPVTFHSTVKKVEEVHTPELSDAFAKEHFGAENVADLRKKIEERMTAEEERVERYRREQQLFEQIQDKTQVKLPPELIEEEEQMLLSQWEDDLRSRGMSAEDWFKQSKKTPVELRADVKDRAEKRIKLRLGLEKIIEEKNKRLTDEQMQPVIKQYLSTLPDDQRIQAASALQKGTEAYERLRWQAELQQTIELMLAA